MSPNTITRTIQIKAVEWQFPFMFISFGGVGFSMICKVKLRNVVVSYPGVYSREQRILIIVIILKTAFNKFVQNKR